MTPEQYAEALVALGYSEAVARIPVPEIAEGALAEARDYHLVHLRDGRIAVQVPDERGNGTVGVWWGDGPAIFDTVDEARAVVFELQTREG